MEALIHADFSLVSIEHEISMDQCFHPKFGSGHRINDLSLSQVPDNVSDVGIDLLVYLIRGGPQATTRVNGIMLAILGSAYLGREKAPIAIFPEQGSHLLVHLPDPF